MTPSPSAPTLVHYPRLIQTFIKIIFLVILWEFHTTWSYSTYSTPFQFLPSPTRPPFLFCLSKPPSPIWQPTYSRWGLSWHTPDQPGATPLQETDFLYTRGYQLSRAPQRGEGCLRSSPYPILTTGLCLAWAHAGLGIKSQLLSSHMQLPCQVLKTSFCCSKQKGEGGTRGIIGQSPWWI